MLTTILIVGVAWYALMVETHWLTVSLEAYETIEQYDKRILAGMEANYWIEYLEKAESYQARYDKWLARRYAEKVSYGGGESDELSPRDKLTVKYEDLEKRRNGEAIYQRGNSAHIKLYNQVSKFQNEWSEL